MWAAPSGSTRGGINYGIPHDFGMVGVRDVFLVAPASSFLQAQQPDPALLSSDPHNGAYLKKPLVIDYGNNNNNFIASASGGGGGGGASSSGTATCQDCGNQAKRDCTHRRCRTCCKSRGFDCSTHVKSTWVPAARRRERQLMVGGGGGGGTGTSSASTSGGGSKKPRLVTSQQTNTTTSHTSNSNNTPPRSFDTSSSHQDAGFKEKLPGQVRAPAVFKCVRVTSMDDGDDEYAYQAMVNIGGHVFKGFLYDQGEETRYPNEFPNISELHLGGVSGKNTGTSLSPMVDDVYGATTGGGGLLGSSNFVKSLNVKIGNG